VSDALEELLALTEREHELAVSCQWEQLAALDAARRDLVARLSTPAPASAQAALERATAIQAHTSALLAASLDELQRELGTLSHGRSAVRGYGGDDAISRAGRIDLAG
jgi:Flagellar protein FliT